MHTYARLAYLVSEHPWLIIESNDDHAVYHVPDNVTNTIGTGRVE
jgi:hypothetical protein